MTRANTPNPSRPRRASAILARAACLALLALLAMGCDRDLTSDYDVVVRVTSEPGRALEGARALLRGKVLGLSDVSGAVAIHVRGREGDVLPIEVACPEGHRPPAAPVLVPLRHVMSGAKPEFAAQCTPTSHAVVVAVRAERGPNLPLLYLGRELARTDASGAAHVVLDVASTDVLELVLDTTAEPRLRPRSPILRIQPGASDAITAISQDFTLQPPPPAPKAPAPVRHGPVRIE